MKIEHVDSWDLFDLRPRKSVWQSLYIGITWAILIWTVIIMLLVLASKPAQAEEKSTWVSVTVRSYHYERKKDYNETWHGIGIERDWFKDTRWVAGVYENSYYETSHYLGASWMPVHLTSRWHLGLTAGIVNGYDKDPFGGFLIPTLTYERKWWGANFGIVPSTGSPFTVLGLQLKAKIP